MKQAFKNLAAKTEFKMTEDDSYIHIARFYDSLIGDRDEIPTIKRLLKKRHPKASNLLELACGTGSILESLSADYQVSGLDASDPMLALAQQRLPGVELLQGDMASFNLEQDYDIIICVFNSINHLLKFSQWKTLFASAQQHLKPGGLFLFDMNTERGLASFPEEAPYLEEVDGDFYSVQYLPAPRQEIEMQVRIFEHSNCDHYRLHRASIYEKAFPTSRVRTELKKHFSKVELFDPDHSRPGAYSDVIYFSASNPKD